MNNYANFSFNQSIFCDLKIMIELYRSNHMIAKTTILDFRLHAAKNKIIQHLKASNVSVMLKSFI